MRVLLYVYHTSTYLAKPRRELGLYFIFPIIFKRGKCETIPTTRGKRKRRGSVAVTGLSNGVLQRRTRRRLLVPFSPARTAEKARQPGYRPQKNSDNVNSKRRDSDSSTNIDRQKPKTAPWNLNGARSLGAPTHPLVTVFTNRTVIGGGRRPDV